MTRLQPRVTFALFVYNQEEYVREAVESALAQDYPNLEIIISDDNSADHTFEIAASMCLGDDRVIIRRNESNMGVARHVNRVMSLATGEIIVAAAGDDISEPYRCSAIVAAWLAAERLPDSLCSSVVKIDEHGEVLGHLACDKWDGVSERMFNGQRWLIGSSHAWTRRTFSVFGDLPDWLLAEDKAIGFRSAMLGGIAHIDRPLVRYRCHPQSISSKNSTAKSARQTHLNLQAHRADLLRMARQNEALADAGVIAEMEKILRLHENRAAALVDTFQEENRFKRVWRTLSNLGSLGARDIVRSFCCRR